MCFRSKLFLAACNYSQSGSAIITPVVLWVTPEKNISCWKHLGGNKIHSNIFPKKKSIYVLGRHFSML